MTGTPLFHVGVLVEDIDAAIVRFGELLGLTFGEPLIMTLEDTTVDGVKFEGSITFVYSVEGPPYLELIQSQDSGLWGRQHGEGLHHIGVSQDDLEARILELQAVQAEPQAIISHLGRAVAVYLTPDSAHGTRLEYVRPRPAKTAPAPAEG